MKTEKIYDCDVLDSSKTYFGLPETVDRFSTKILLRNYDDDLSYYAKERKKLLVLTGEINEKGLTAKKYVEFFGPKGLHREDVYFIYDEKGEVEKIFYYASPQSRMKATLFEYDVVFKKEGLLFESHSYLKDGLKMMELAEKWESQNNAFVFL